MGYVIVRDCSLPPEICEITVRHRWGALESQYAKQKLCSHCSLNYFSRGLWTWPPWVICAPSLNHKIGIAAHSGISEVLFFTKSHKWKKQRWKKLTTGGQFRETVCFWTIQEGWPTDPITTEIITSQCGLTMSWLFSVISLQQLHRWKFRNMFMEYSTCLLFYLLLNARPSEADQQNSHMLVIIVCWVQLNVCMCAAAAASTTDVISLRTAMFVLLNCIPLNSVSFGILNT